MIAYYIYSLLIFGFLPIIAISTFWNRSKPLIISLLVWFILRFLADLFAHFFYQYFELNIYPIFHISVLLEALALITFFISLDKNPSKKKQWIYLIPIVVFVLETIFTGSLFQVNRLSIVSYNLLISVLMMRLLVYYDKIDSFLVPIVKSLFVFHVVSFISSLFEHVLRINSEMMSFVYPGFLLLILSLNLFFTYYLWSTRKN